MRGDALIPGDPLDFIRQCARDRRVYWTYHVTMRMAERSMSRQTILDSVASFEVIEAYPEDKYLPSYLVRADDGQSVFHVLFAADVLNRNIRVVTAYAPDPEEWDHELRRRKSP